MKLHLILSIFILTTYGLQAEPDKAPIIRNQPVLQAIKTIGKNADVCHLGVGCCATAVCCPLPTTISASFVALIGGSLIVVGAIERWDQIPRRTSDERCLVERNRIRDFDFCPFEVSN